MRQRKAIAAVQRRAQIMQYAFDRTKTPQDRFSIHELAYHMKVTPSTKLRTLVRGLLDSGQLVEVPETWTGAVKVRYLYAITPAAKKSYEKVARAQRKMVINGEAFTIASE